MNSKCIAVVLAVLVAAADGTSFAKLAKPILLPGQKNWDGLGLQADINQYIDETISMLVPFIKDNKLDPMDLPDIRQGFQVRPLLITYSAWLNLRDGHVTGLTNIARSGDQRVNYHANMLRLRLNFQFTDLEFVYRYRVQVMNIGPGGGLVGSLNRFTVVFDVLIDFNNDELQLQEFAIRDVGRLRVRLNGNVLIDWLVNPVIRVFTAIFDNTLINVVSNNIRRVIQNALTSVNSHINETVERLESFGH